MAAVANRPPVSSAIRLEGLRRSAGTADLRPCTTTVPSWVPKEIVDTGMTFAFTAAAAASAFGRPGVGEAVARRIPRWWPAPCAPCRRADRVLDRAESSVDRLADRGALLELEVRDRAPSRATAGCGRRHDAPARSRQRSRARAGTGGQESTKRAAARLAACDARRLRRRRRAIDCDTSNASMTVAVSRGTWVGQRRPCERHDDSASANSRNAAARCRRHPGRFGATDASRSTLVKRTRTCVAAVARSRTRRRRTGDEQEQDEPATGEEAHGVTGVDPSGAGVAVAATNCEVEHPVTIGAQHDVLGAGSADARAIACALPRRRLGERAAAASRSRSAPRCAGRSRCR